MYALEDSLGVDGWGNNSSNTMVVRLYVEIIQWTTLSPVQEDNHLKPISE